MKNCPLMERGVSTAGRGGKWLASGGGAMTWPGQTPVTNRGNSRSIRRKMAEGELYMYNH